MKNPHNSRGQEGIEESARIHAYGSSYRHRHFAGGHCRGGAVGARFDWFQLGESQRLFGLGVCAAADGPIPEPAAQYVDQSASLYRNYRLANLYVLSRRPNTALKYARGQPVAVFYNQLVVDFSCVAGSELQLHLSGSERSVGTGLRRPVGGDHHDERRLRSPRNDSFSEREKRAATEFTIR